VHGKAKVKGGLMNIGKVEELSGLSVEAIRFYERAGVLPKPKRKPSGYRQFDLETVARIRFIKRIQEMGFSLSEAGALASSKGIPKAIDRIERQIGDLKNLQRELIKRSESARNK
jgi:DNA-binding transcriptional MerR regulator